MRGLLVAAALAAAAAQSSMNGTVRLAGGKFVFEQGVVDATGVAYGTYVDMAGMPGAFGTLDIASNAAYNDTTQLFAAGYLEGALTAPRIKQQADNMLAWVKGQFANGTVAPVVVSWFAQQDAWARAQVAANASSPIWAATGAVLAQLDGLIAGYNAAAPAAEQLSVLDFQLLNALGDLLDLITALVPSSERSFPDWDELDTPAFMDRVRKTGHCSALVKVTGDFSELYFAHAAWFEFSSMSRIWKSYSFPVSVPGAVGQQMSFSSYPGYLESLDDYWAVWSSGLWVSETTNNIFNTSLYKVLTPESLWSWQRVRNANLLASSGGQWVDVFGTANSGTYNNQWIVVDVKKFTPGSPLPEGLLTIAEQIPGGLYSEDKTETLTRGFWPSYNVPSIRAVYDASGYPEQIARRRASNGSLGAVAGIDYQLAPRAKIFRRDQSQGETLNGFLDVMRYNNYLVDPYAVGADGKPDPWSAICSRGDLAGSPGGCLDGKAGSFSSWAARRTLVINGPTTGSAPPGGTLPPFSWSAFPGTPHEGLPETYDFAFQAVAPNWAA